MKVLIVNKFLYPNGGSETYIFRIGRCLEQMGHEVQYFGMEHDGRIVGNRAGIYTRNMDFHGGGFRGRLSKMMYPFRIIYSREAARKMEQVLEDFHPDVVHLNNINFQLTPSVIEAVADHDIRNGTDTRIIYTAHDSQWVCPGHLLYLPDACRRCFDCEGGRYMNCIRNRCIHGSRIRSMLGALEAYVYKVRRTYELVDTVICPSSFMRDRLQTNPHLNGRCVVLHNFVDTPASQGESADTKRPDGRYVIYFGRYSREKGIKTLLEACRRLPDVHFIFAGSGPLEDEVNTLSNITNVGFKSGPDLAALVSGAAFSIFPSECHENCSFTVMESISYGTPIIASDTGGTPELVSDGINGLLFEAGDTDDLTAKIRRLWDDPSETDRLHGGCTKSHFMSVEEYCVRLLDIYENRA